jgi:hypothetical protein
LTVRFRIAADGSEDALAGNVDLITEAIYRIAVFDLPAFAKAQFDVAAKFARVVYRPSANDATSLAIGTRDVAP